MSETEETKTIIIKAGKFYIECNDGDASHAIIKYNGKELRGVTSLKYSLEHGELPILELTVYPDQFGTENETDPIKVDPIE